MLSKVKCADLGRSLRKGASTTLSSDAECLHWRPRPLSQSRALDFVWLCFGTFGFRFFAWLRSCCWPLALLGGEQDPTPFRVLLLCFPPGSQLRCTVCNALQNILTYFYLFEEALRGSFEMANSSCPQARAGTVSDSNREHLDARPLKGVRQCADGHELSFSLCHKQKPRWAPRLIL